MTINTNSFGWVLPIFYVKAEIRSNHERIIAPKKHSVKKILSARQDTP